MSLVRFDALTLAEFVEKCSLKPAQMLGLPKKGHLDPGADGDLVVADPETHRALLTVAGGRVIMIHGMVVGSGGTIITTERGKRALEDQDVRFEMANLPCSLLYRSSPD